MAPISKKGRAPMGAKRALLSEGGGITANLRRPQGPWSKKAAVRAGPRLRRAAEALHRSGFLVGSDIAVDEVGDVVVILLFLFQEWVVRRLFGVLLDIDVVDDRLGSLLLARLAFVERHGPTPSGAAQPRPPLPG